MQSSVEVEMIRGLRFIVWCNFDLDKKGGKEHQFCEVDLSADFVISSDREVSISISSVLPGQPYLIVAYGVGGPVLNSMHVEGGLETQHEIAHGVMWGGGAGLACAVPDKEENGLSYYRLKTGVEYALVSLGVCYMSRISPDVLSDDSYDKKWPLTLSFERCF